MNALRLIQSIIMFLFCSLLVHGQTQQGVTSTIAISSSTVTQGEEKNIYLDLNNPDKAYVGAQFDIDMPQGIAITQVQRVNTRLQTVDNNVATVMNYVERADGSTRVIMLPNSSLDEIYPFSGTSGSIVKISIKVSTDIAPGTYQIGIRNVRLTDALAKVDRPADKTDNLTVSKKEVYQRLVYMLDGQLFKAMNVLEGETVTNPSVTAKEGFSFSGWDKVIKAMPNHSDTIRGHYIPNKYTIKFQDYDGSVIAENVNDFGSKLEQPSGLQRVGYTFAGFYEDVTNRTGEPVETVPAHDLTYTAAYDINSYTMRFLDDDGEVLSAITQEYDTSFELPESPTKKGHSFAGWDKEVPKTIPPYDADFTARYSVNKYKVTFIIDNTSLKN